MFVAHIVIFWILTLCNVACFYRRFGGTFYLHLQRLGELGPSSRSSSLINGRCKQHVLPRRC